MEKSTVATVGAVAEAEALNGAMKGEAMPVLHSIPVPRTVELAPASATVVTTISPSATHVWLETPDCIVRAAVPRTMAAVVVAFAPRRSENVYVGVAVEPWMPVAR